MYPNKIRISNGEGQVSITAISRAFEVGQVADILRMVSITCQYPTRNIPGLLHL